jgi:hypothetical protein
MGTQKSSGKERKYVQRKLEEPVEKVVDQKLNDPFIATKKGEREATEELQKGIDEATRKPK